MLSKCRAHTIVLWSDSMSVVVFGRIGKRHHKLITHEVLIRLINLSVCTASPNEKGVQKDVAQQGSVEICCNLCSQKNRIMNLAEEWSDETQSCN